MVGMDRWDWVLLAAAGFVAVVVLVRLMLNHRNRLLMQLRAEIEQEQARKRRAEQQAKQLAARQQHPNNSQPSSSPPNHSPRPPIRGSPAKATRLERVEVVAASQGRQSKAAGVSPRICANRIRKP